VQVVNSDLKEPIDYEGHEDAGLNVIAVGGDKLSRGLTLEGLSVSYFLRASKMYDSLMQMGRWFGYRPGYVDLCRLYMPVALERWFRHVATAAEELRDRLDRMVRLGARPKDYGLKVQSHSSLLVTAQNKMRHASEHQVSFAGDGKIQTVFFQDREINLGNGRLVEAFLALLGPLPAEGFSVVRPGGKTATGQGRLWTGVDGAAVADLLGSFRFPADTLDPPRMKDYIRAQLAIGELTDWTVILPAGRGTEQNFASSQIRTVTREVLKRNEIAGEFSYRTILSPGDETIDLSADEFAYALDLTNRSRATNGKTPTDRPAGPDIRIARGLRPQRALLLIYPIDPVDAGLADLGMPLFGIVVSFPESLRATSLTYTYNSVERRLELQ
jgi:Z1 domain